MINQIVLVGKVVELPQIKETSTGVKYANLCVEVERSYKNGEGNYDKDRFLCTVWRGVAESCVEFCQKNSVVGIKGRVQSSSYTSEEGQTYLNYEIVAEKVSFLKGE